jgi:hypothetical protein
MPLSRVIRVTPFSAEGCAEPETAAAALTNKIRPVDRSFIPKLTHQLTVGVPELMGVLIRNQTTRSKKLKPVLAITLLAVTPMFAAADQWDKHWDVSGTPDLAVSVGDAAVTIRAGNSGGISAHVETRGWKIGGDGIQIHEQLTGNHLDLSIKEPHEHFSFGEHNIKVELRVPQNILANLRSGDGPITLRDVHGTVDTRTGDGPVRVEGFSGVLRAHTGDGPVTLDGRFDDLEIHTGDGPVNVSAASGSKVQTAWHVSTGDGPVNMKLPGDLRANVELHTGDGPISLNVPLTVSGTQNKHDMHGSLNGGGPEVRINTGDGPIVMGKS